MKCKQRIFRKLCMAVITVLVATHAIAGQQGPKGLMLNLDFQNVQSGLIPNNGFYPLYVPLGKMAIENMLGENMLVLTPEQGLDVPHSSLIQPDGSEWIVSIELGAHTNGGNGMVVSQCDDEHGYAIYLKNGAPRAVVRTGNCAMMLKEDQTFGLTDCRKQMTTVELRIKPDMAILTINRKRAALVMLDGPLDGENMPIRIGNHPVLPAILQNIPGVEPFAFSGAISSLKVWRQ